MKKVSIIIPVRNEEKLISKMLEHYLEVFLESKRLEKLDFEFVLVVNASTDRTAEIVKQYSEKYEEIKYLEFIPGGKGFALIEGFKDALKRDNDFIGFVDADISTPARAYYDLVANIGNRDGIIASRWLKQSKVSKRGIVRSITSFGFNFGVRSLFLFPYRDTQCGAKLFKKQVIETIVYGLNLTRWAFDINLLYLCKKHRFRIKEIPTTWIDRAETRMTSVFKVTLQMALGAVRLRLVNSIFEPILRPVKFILRIADKLIND